MILRHFFLGYKHLLPVLLFLSILAFEKEQCLAQSYYGKYHEVPISEITPKGWLAELLTRQRNGLGINHTESGYPYNTCLWAGEIPKGGNPKGQSWWPYEQTGYLVDGLYRCGILLKDTSLINIGKRSIAYVLAHPRSNGQLCNESLGWTQWPFVVFVRTMMADYEVTRNPAILEALTKHFMALREDLGEREICIIESMCWTYQKTHDARLIEKAEKIWINFSSNTNTRNKNFQQDKMVASDTARGHGVTVSEVGKQPAILYLSTGKEIYKQAAVNYFKAVLRDNGLVDGIPSSSESLAGLKPEGSHETCDISDFTWSWGYVLMATGESAWGDQIERGIFNAGLGAISKDFKSHEYFSSPNQVFATQTSSMVSPRKEWKSRQAYRPGFDTECCSGNVHRMIPNYAARMWMKDKANGIVATLYGPNVISTKLGSNNHPVVITEDTEYPFAGKIKFTFKMTKAFMFPFSVRIPEWAKGATVIVNNEAPVSVTNGTFFTLNRTFTSGDKIVINLPMNVVKESPVENGVSLTRGPLVFSLLITEDAKPITNQEKTSVNFPAWDINPASSWNYALALSDNLGEVVVNCKPISGFPWLPENSPVTLTVPAKRIPMWQAQGTMPKLPEVGFETSVNEQVKLVPEGSTRIRLCVFPRVE